jgi:ligand-binding sensor domain-containing protein
LRKIISVILIFYSLYLEAQQVEPGIGMWREHMPYNSSIDIAFDGEKVYSATPYSLFTVNISDESVERLSRITGLSETGISVIEYDPVNQKLFIGYENSNIDIVYRNDIINLPDIKQDDVVGDKRINEVYPLNNKFYLSTGLGVIVIDAERYEVSETWYLGTGGAQLKVNGFTSDGSFYYAATADGLKRAPMTGLNLADYANWQLLSGLNGLPAGESEDVVTLASKVIVHKNDSLYLLNGNSWTLFYADGWGINNANVSEGRILVSQMKPSGESKVTILDESGTVLRTITQLEPISFPRKAMIVNGNPWLADQFGGLTHFEIDGYKNYKPDSPESTASGDMTVRNGVFYATAGSVNEAWNYQFNSNGIFVLRNGDWTNINRFRFPQIDSLLDYITIAIDPRDESIWSGSYGGGLLHVIGEQEFEIFKQGFIDEAAGDPTSYRVSGLAFDNQNNLWISNFAAQQPLLVRKNDGTWMKFSIPLFLFENSLTQIVIDDDDQKWILASKSNNVIVFDDNNSIDNIGDDRWRVFGSGVNNGNLPEGEVLCMAKDKSGFIWVGTTNGIGVIQCPYEAFTQGCDAVWPIVDQGNFSGYLFNGEEVRSIAVDGGDRKWIATRNGVWLISPTGEQLIHHFTETNSPLLSNDVRKITIDGRTGEVFFATLKGICSFRGSATEGGDTNQDVIVFPNPVPPGFTGNIGIRGVVNNAIVKITELNGRLVYQTRALGGQANWDGKDYQGRRVSSGVYLVLINEDGSTGEPRKEKASAKIIFLSR